MNNRERVPEHAGRIFRKILLVRLDRIGDVLLTTPVITAFRAAYPDSHIAFMVRPYAREVVEGNPLLDEVIVYDKKMGLVNTGRFIKYLSRSRFDLAVILHPTARTHLLTFLAGIPNRLGYDRKGGALLTMRIPHTKQLGLRHEIDYCLELIAHAGVPAGDKRLTMPVTDKGEEAARRLFAEHGIRPDETVVALNPGASCRSKRWRPEHFASVGDSLARQYGARILLLAGSSDKECADAVASRMASPSVNLAGITTVTDLASILKRCRLFISNDSGPVHIACAVRTPVIAIFGRSDRGLSPKRWGPSNPGDVVLHKDAGCVVCRAHGCANSFKCLDAVTVDDVLSAARRILQH